MTEPQSLVGYEVRDEVGFVTLQSPPLNLMTAAMMHQLADAVERARADRSLKAIAITAAPLLGLAAGGLTFAVVHFLDDEGPKGTGRLLRYAGAGMLLGTVGGYSYAFAF